MIRRWAIVPALLALGHVSAADAQDIADALCKTALKGDGVIDPIDLRAAALAGVSADTLDYDHDGTITAREIFSALTIDASLFCTVKDSSHPAGRARPCADGADNSLRQAHNNLDGYKAKNGTLFDAVVVGRPSPADIGDARALETIEGQMIDDRGRFLKMTCRRPDTVATTTTAGKGMAFLLGKDIDSLTVKRAGKEPADRLKKVTAASISYTADNAANTRTFAVDAVAGLQVAKTDTFTFIPFVQYSRSEVRDRTAKTDKLTGKFAIGAVSSLQSGDDQFNFAPLYARDLKNRSELLGARLTWRPGVLYRLPTFNNALHFACPETSPGVCKRNTGLALWTDFQFVTSFGTVLVKGNDPTFIDGRNYFRIGPSGNVHLYGLGGVVRDFSFDAGYKRLFKLAGDSKPVYALTADVSYWINGSANVSLTTGYEHSRDEDTLEVTDKWKLGLGVRF